MDQQAADTTGVSSGEALKRLKQDGYNELPFSKRRSILRIAFDVIKEPMLLLLVACGTLYFTIGDIKEAAILVSFVFVVIGITLYQERKTERALEALRDLSSPRAMVIRDGKHIRIPGREVVTDDIVIVSEGDRVPADAVLLNSNNVTVDESLLTGESVPVRKSAWDGVQEMNSPGGDDLPFIYSGTLVVQGQGTARVIRTGLNTELGKIGKILQVLEPEETLLHRETRQLVRNFTIFAVALSALVIVIYGITRANWSNGFLAGLTLAMAILPEEFPVVLTIFLALGAWRISKEHVLTRRVSAIETLGAATVLCVDKTGTLTQNRMSVAKLYSSNEFFDLAPNYKKSLPENFHQLLEFAILSSQSDPRDPMESALKGLGNDLLSHTGHLHTDWEMEHEYSLSKELLAMSRVWKSADGKDYVIAAKGAPEAIADLCHLSPGEKERLAENVSIMAGEGLRVLGIAKAYFSLHDLPRIQHDFDFQFIGIIGFADPIRPSVPEALRECYGAGIRVIMITGDYPLTAKSIAAQIGLKASDEVLTGAELDRMHDDELMVRLKTVNIFARAVPEQKLRIVNALKANGEIVAMTGDGVNDAPALKAAHIGIAMGARGTDVAREAASLVLLDDDFSSIVKSVRMGRRIYYNLKKAMAYILAIHVPIAGISLIPVLFGWPLILMPVHIAFLELIIDPSSSVVFEAEAEETDVMKRRPRRFEERLFNRRTFGISILQGGIVLAIVLAIFIISMHMGQTETESRTLTVTTLIIANLGLILTNRSWSRTIVSTLGIKNRALWGVVSGAMVFLVLTIYVPFLQSLFRFSTLKPLDIGICFGAGLLSIGWFETIKLYAQLKRKNM
ncbi:MAG: cation-translocating P-type ATPase [Deltaproteobacteria bacterium]|nr:cation-translocating P-type ATPase [Deltaproteobacteria bacterium]